MIQAVTAVHSVKSVNYRTLKNVERAGTLGYLISILSCALHTLFLEMLKKVD